MALESNVIIDKKILMVVLHNVACCHQKIKDFNLCITYLDAILFHFDGIIESKFSLITTTNTNNNSTNLTEGKLQNKNHINNTKHTSNQFNHYFTDKKYSINSFKELSDFILMLRFSSKFHLQICAVYSQNGNHQDAIKQSKISAKISEDNFKRTKNLLNYIISTKNNHNYSNNTISNTTLNNDANNTTNVDCVYNCNKMLYR